MGLGVRSLGTTPIFRKNALGVKRPFSELSESSGVFSEQLSELEIPFSECEIPFSEWPLTTWSIRNPQFSEQLSERFPELPRTHPKDFHSPLHSRSVFSRIGWSLRTRRCFYREPPLKPSWVHLKHGFSFGFSGPTKHDNQRCDRTAVLSPESFAIFSRFYGFPFTLWMQKPEREKETHPLQKIREIQRRQRPEAAEFCPLSWSVSTEVVVVGWRRSSFCVCS